jgi:chromosome segregation protein
MHIQQIEIDNFKSFNDKTVIPFQNGFTTVSGPNGSGKSNIIDSILFCLGLSSSRTMRAEKLTDLINNLSKRREASVSILFSRTEDPDSEKVLVSRRVKDNGQQGYGSTYSLNGRTSTLTEIHEALSQHNISPGAYNVLMQGDVTGIINMSATERRKIIDEIAGVAEFDRKIDQAQKELESVSGSIERFTILTDELKLRLEQLSQDRDLALKYQRLKDEKQHYESLTQAAQFFDLQKALGAAEQNIVETRKQKQQSAKQLQVLEQEIYVIKQTLDTLTQEVKRKGEDQQIALKKQIEGLKGAISRKKDSLQFGAQKKQENTQQIERATQEIARIKAIVEDLETVMAGYTAEENRLQDLLTQEKLLLADIDLQIEALSSASGTLGSARKEAHLAWSTAQDDLAETERHSLDIQAKLSRNQEDASHLQDRVQSSQSRMQTVHQERLRLENGMSEDLLEKQAFEAQIQQQQLAYAQTKVALNTTAQEVVAMHREYAQIEAQRRAYEDMNFGRSIDTVLNAGIAGVHGTLTQLGRVDEDYSLAMEIALGGRMKSIVVDTERVAEDCIQLLQQRKAGRATFLPLSKMNSGSYLNRLPDDEGIIDYAVNLIEFDAAYNNIFAYALSDTLIVEDMAVARKYLRKYRMVTLDGSLLEKTGAMTGGSTSNNNSGNKFSNTNKLEEQVDALRKRLEKKDKEKETLEKALSLAEIKLDTLKDDYARFLSQLQQNQLALDAINREEGELKHADGLPDKLAALLEAATLLQEQLQMTQGQKITLLAKTEALAQKLAEIDAQLPVEKIEALKNQQRDVEFQVKTLEGHLRETRNDKQSKALEKEFQSKAVLAFEEQITLAEKNSHDVDKQREAFLEEIQAIDIQIKALEAQTGELDEELKRLQAERDTVQQQLIAQERVRYDLNKEATLFDEKILSFQARIRELTPAIAQIREALEKAQMDIETIDTESLPSSEELLQNIQRLSRKMDALEPVNMRAIQEFDDVSARFESLNEKVLTLSREKEDLSIKINGYAELKLNTFMTAFDNVDRNFREIFQELSDGEGHLVLTNPMDPFSGGLTIQAQPRGKKMQRIESMSGGEKSLTALAFVFSFQRYMPAPFYAFDEVDMFLDGINAEKLAHMVKKQSQNAQFIVVSLRKPMLNNSDRTIGVTQRKDGISRVTGVLLRDAS